MPRFLSLPKSPSRACYGMGDCSAVGANRCVSATDGERGVATRESSASRRGFDSTSRGRRLVECGPHLLPMETVTWRASDVLRRGTGLCFAKAHLLAALLRAVGVPCGLCYQVLRCDASSSITAILESLKLGKAPGTTRMQATVSGPFTKKVSARGLRSWKTGSGGLNGIQPDG